MISRIPKIVKEINQPENSQEKSISEKRESQQKSSINPDEQELLLPDLAVMVDRIDQALQKTPELEIENSEDWTEEIQVPSRQSRRWVQFDLD
jgi:hypothetical protein